MLEYRILQAPKGSVVVLGAGRTVAGIIMTHRVGEDARQFVRHRHPEARHNPRLLSGLCGQLASYFAGRRVQFDVDFDLSGMTGFQQRVLRACAELDYGQTATYGELARRIGRPKASRAVGAALGRNPLPLVIPCHRVIGCNGGLGGFSAEQGVAMKRWLLDLEQRGA
jgi:methylated-DNA-[protein]-cysteine S-methyltransferase